MEKRILICGDSFAADWTVKYKNRGKGWPNLLEENFLVNNLAQAGCGEYKIFKQLDSQDLSQYDFIIISHTSPYRIHTNFHPIHSGDLLHRNADFIYNDIKEHAKKNSQVKCIVEYFEKYFDTEYANFVHTMICEKINNKLKNFPNVLHIAHFNWKEFFSFENMLVIEEFLLVENGLNHYSVEDNFAIYNKVLEKINKEI